MAPSRCTVRDVIEHCNAKTCRDKGRYPGGKLAAASAPASMAEHHDGVCRVAVQPGVNRSSPLMNCKRCAAASALVSRSGRRWRGGVMNH